MYQPTYHQESAKYEVSMIIFELQVQKRRMLICLPDSLALLRFNCARYSYVIRTSLVQHFYLVEDRMANRLSITVYFLSEQYEA